MEPLETGRGFLEMRWAHFGNRWSEGFGEEKKTFVAAEKLKNIPQHDIGLRVRKLLPTSDYEYGSKSVWNWKKRKKN
jgi:hypothetical protein